MFVILTNRPGQFRTEPGEGLEVVELYDYLFCGHGRATFVIARLVEDSRVCIVDECDARIVNTIRTKLLPRFATLHAARQELEGLVGSGCLAIHLFKRVPK